MNETVLIDYLHRLENKIDIVNEKLYQNGFIIQSHTDKLDSLVQESGEIKEQTMRTNGRVTSLESTTAKLAIVASQNAGLIKVNQDKIEETLTDQSIIHRVIDEIKKSLGIVEVIHSTENVEKRKLWLEILKHTITAVTSILATLLAAYLSLKYNIKP